MVSRGSKIKVVIVDDDAEIRDSVSRLLELEDDFDVVGMAEDGAKGVEIVKDTRPHVVIMDVNMPVMNGFEATQQISELFPRGLRVVFLSVQMDKAYYRRAMQLHVADYLEKPVTPETLYSALRLAAKDAFLERQQPDLPAATTSQKATGQIITLFSPKGGVGTTVLAANLGAGLAQAGHKTVVVDTDLEFGDIAVSMNVRAPNSLLELVDAAGDVSTSKNPTPGSVTEVVKWAGVRGAEQVLQQTRFGVDIDPDVLPRIAVTHNSGCDVIIAPPRPELGELIGTDALIGVLSFLQYHYDYVVIDTASRVSGPTLSILDNTDKLLVVTMPSIPALKNTRVFYALLESISFPTGNVHLVVNHAGLTKIDSERIGNYLRVPIVCEVAHDPAVEDAITKGEIIAGADLNRVPAAKGIAQLVEFVTAAEEEEETATMAAKAQAKARQPRGTGWLRNPFTDGNS